MTTRVVHVNSEEWKNTPEDQRVYIGRAVPRRGFRASQYANNYHIGKHGTREECIAKNELDLRKMCISGPASWSFMCIDLKGKVLGCWCKEDHGPDVPCHGDTLAKLVEMTIWEYMEWLNQ